ncbi:CRAL-TRIO domain [Ostreococcus tauri]|uniref:CRAL-TRIO domain n=2 Tax=Ostreococcus tauri TaxID=70448 RepID=A0A090M556_OSTTA|nr:CRAL-TRIO domain [Ostreococcus tauri]CEF97812.1 CRAL-TRIO domain [Ostreococcus tauri]|eukprot:XP_003079119.2 CRAL-TRIO domain [Ostreococcus tauri]
MSDGTTTTPRTRTIARAGEDGADGATTTTMDATMDASETMATHDGTTTVTLDADADDARDDRGTETAVTDADGVETPRRATDEDYARLDAYLTTGFGLVHADGRDGEGRTVVTINATRIPGWAGGADRERALKLIVRALAGAAEDRYVVVVYFGNGDRTEGVVPTHALNWLSDVHGALEYRVRKNVEKIVFVNASWLTSTIISFSTTFASSKVSKKFVWTRSLQDMEKDTKYHVNASMLGESFLRSINVKIEYRAEHGADAE